MCYPDKMCEKKLSGIRKNSHLLRLREQRRMQHLQWRPPPPNPNANPTPCPQQAVEKALQNRVLLELAWKTVALMHKNRLIQQKIVALQKETSEFITSIMSNPESKRRYIEHAQRYALSQSQKTLTPDKNIPVKMEADA